MRLSQQLTRLVQQFLAGEATVRDLYTWCNNSGRAVHAEMPNDPGLGELYATVWEAVDACASGMIDERTARSILAEAVPTTVVTCAVFIGAEHEVTVRETEWVPAGHVGRASPRKVRFGRVVGGSGAPEVFRWRHDGTLAPA